MSQIDSSSLGLVDLIGKPLLLGASLFIGGAIIVWASSEPDPAKTKPLPNFDAFKAELEKLAQTDPTEEYKLMCGPCRYSGAVHNSDRKFVASAPDGIRGNVYRAILVTNELFPNKNYFIRDTYDKAAHKWNPKTESFMDVFCRCACKKDRIYLKKKVTL
jgi:hypothetical protein